MIMGLAEEVLKNNIFNFDEKFFKTDMLDIFALP